MDLIKLLKSTTDIEKRGWDIIHQHDSPQNIALLPAIESKKVKHLISRLDFLNVDQNDQVDLNSTDNWQAQASIRSFSGDICMALTWCLSFPKFCWLESTLSLANMI